MLKPPHSNYAMQESIVNQILSHLRSNCLPKAISTLWSSTSEIPFSLYARLFNLCASDQAIIEARKLESHLITFNSTPPVFLLNRAIETYGKCGCLRDAHELFDEMPEKNGGSWNALITAYSQNGLPQKAFSLFSTMCKQGISCNEITFANVLGSCGAVFELCLLRQVHALVMKYGLLNNTILGSSIVDVYGKCLFMSDARRMFDEIENKNPVSWNVIVRRYLEVGDEREAIVVFFKMIGANLTPLNYTISSALNACSCISGLKEGVQIHGVAVRLGFDKNELVSNSLINMYSKCGDLDSSCKIFDEPSLRNLFSCTSMVSAHALSGRITEARQIFVEMLQRSVITWNAMLAGYVRFSLWEEALDFVLSSMREMIIDGDGVTFVLLLKVCSGLSDVEMGKQVHGFVYRHGFYSDLHIGNGILDMYGKCGTLKSARVWFCVMSHFRDKVSWNALLTSYTRHGFWEEAMATFGQMPQETAPSKYTFGSLLAACANLLAFQQGKQIHGFMIRNGYEIDAVIRGALLDMYSKCKCVEYALKVFNEANSRDLILWNSIIMGCGYNGRGKDVLELFELMKHEGVSPDHITFHGILLACTYEGLAELGSEYFSMMSEKYCIIPRPEHYECMIKLYSRCQLYDKLDDLMKNMPS